MKLDDTVGLNMAGEWGGGCVSFIHSIIELLKL